MSFKLLKLLLNFGKIWGVTLNLNYRKCRIVSRIFIVIYRLLFLFWIVTGLVFKYKQNLKTVVIKTSGILLDISLVGMYLYTLFIISYKKRKKWDKLIRNLELIKVEENDNYGYVVVVLVVNVFGFAIITFALFKALNNSEDFWLSHFVVILEATFTTYIIYLLCVVARMILIRYKNLQKFIKNYDSRHFNKMVILKQAQFIMYHLKVTVDLYNELFGWLLLGSFTVSISSILCYIQLFIVYQFPATAGVIISALLGFFLLHVSIS